MVGNILFPEAFEAALGNASFAVFFFDAAADKFSGIKEPGIRSKTYEGFATMFYSRFFRRPPEQNALDSWITRFGSGDITGSDLINAFVFGEENQVIISDYSNSEFILFLYEVIFDRAPGTDNLNTWLALMDIGVTREEVVFGFTHSTEFENLCNQFGLIPYSGYVNE